MPVLNKDTLREELKAHRLRSAYLLYGPETFLRDGAARYITQQAFGEGDYRDLNQTSFSLSTDPDLLRQAIGAAEQLPMMATRRLVRITDIRISATGHRDTVVEDHEELVRNYLSNPSPTSVVVFIADELNGNRKMGKLLKELCSAVEFTPLSDKDLIHWTAIEFGKLGVEASSEIIRQLVARVGTDLHRLNNEIRKVAAAIQPSQTITSDVIENLIPVTREIGNFALTDHLIAGQKGKTMATLKRLLDDGVEPLVLLGSIAYVYRRLLMAKDLMEKGAGRSDVTRAVGGHPAGHESLFAAARRARLTDLVEAVRSIAAADVAIKTSIGGSTSGARMQIEVLVARLALLTA